MLYLCYVPADRVNWATTWRFRGYPRGYFRIPIYLREIVRAHQPRSETGRSIDPPKHSTFSLQETRSYLLTTWAFSRSTQARSRSFGVELSTPPEGVSATESPSLPFSQSVGPPAGRTVRCCHPLHRMLVFHFRWSSHDRFSLRIRQVLPSPEREKFKIVMGLWLVGR